MNLDHITTAHIKAALGRIDREGLPSGRSSRRYAIHDAGRAYPPRYALSLASEIATGRAMEPADMPDSHGLNKMLRRLGFTVVDRGASSRSARTARVGRAWMRMDVSQKAFRAVPQEQRWDEHRRLVAQAYDADPAAYVRRVDTLVAQAGAENVDVLLLPACALVQRAPGSFRDYDLSPVRRAVAGVLTLDGPPGEFAVGTWKGCVFHVFEDDRIFWFDAERCSIMAAPSSSVRRLVELPDEEPERAVVERPEDGPVLILAFGHHPYSDHYRRLTLSRAVAAAARHARGPAAAVLSSWQYASTRPGPSWCMPDTSACWWRVHDERDALDILDVTICGPE